MGYIMGDFNDQLLPCWVERRIVVVWLRGIQTFPYNKTTPVK